MYRNQRKLEYVRHITECVIVSVMWLSWYTCSASSGHLYHAEEVMMLYRYQSGSGKCGQAEESCGGSDKRCAGRQG